MASLHHSHSRANMRKGHARRLSHTSRSGDPDRILVCAPRHGGSSCGGVIDEQLLDVRRLELGGPEAPTTLVRTGNKGVRRMAVSARAMLAVRLLCFCACSAAVLVELHSSADLVEAQRALADEAVVVAEVLARQVHDMRLTGSD